MIIIPEREVVIITPPRTASSSLLAACKEQYPLTMSLYRHMEADGIPFGYEKWCRYGIVRDPRERLYSLYKYLEQLPPDMQWNQELCGEAREMVFSQWLIDSRVPFTNPFWMDTRFNPRQQCLHPIPETRKSQWHYVRPDLGVTPIVLGSWEWQQLLEMLGLKDLKVLNSSRSLPSIGWGMAAEKHLNQYHRWDVDTVRSVTLA